MFNNNTPKFSMICVSSRNIIHNGISFGVNTLYTNINGLERKYTSLMLPKKINFENYLDNEISNSINNSQRGFKALDNIHQRNLQRTRSQFFDIKKMIENVKDDEIDELTSEKEKELEELEKYGNDIDSKSISTLNDTYMETETNKINQKMNYRKNQIDKKYQFKKPNLEMDKNDKEKIQNYKNQIKSLNKYSSNSNFKKVINYFDLDKYV